MEIKLTVEHTLHPDIIKFFSGFMQPQQIVSGTPTQAAAPTATPQISITTVPAKAEKAKPAAAPKVETATQPKEEEVEAAPAPTPTAEAVVSSITLEALRAAVGEKAKANAENRDKLKAILTSYAVDSLPNLPTEKYAEFLNQVNAL